MAIPTIDEKIAWINKHIETFDMAIAESEDDDAILLYKDQLNYFYAILDDLYSIRLWQHVHGVKEFDLHVLPIMLN